jgi:hypothetical protein
VFPHPDIHVRIANERHRERVRDAERRTFVRAAMRFVHERVPWPAVPDFVPAHWVRDAIRR